MDRREFMKIAGSGLALALLPSCEVEDYQDTKPSLRVSYFPDRHVGEYTKSAARYITNNLKGIDAMCLEGLTGDIDQKYFDEIKKVKTHRAHIYEKNKSLLENFERRNDVNNLEKSIVKVLSSKIAWSYLLKLNCCNVRDDLLGSPGVDYALELFQKVPLFGVEDGVLYKEVVQIVQDFFKDKFYILYRIFSGRGGTDKAIQFIEKNFSVEELKSGSDRFSSRFGEKPLKDIAKDKEREFAVIENISKKFSKRHVGLVMGVDHDYGLEKAAKKRGINFEVFKGF